jgi:CBS domain containing-hemolysin-like protein
VGEHWSELLSMAALGIIFVVMSLLQKALRALSVVVARRMADEAGTPARKLLTRYLQTPMEFMLHVQLVIQFSLVGITLLAHRLFLQSRPRSALPAAFLVMVAGVLLLEQLFPRFVVSVNTEKLVSRLLPAYGLLEPLVRSLAWPVSRVYRVVFRARRAEHAEVSDEEIQAFLDVGAQAGIIRRDEGEILESIFEFSSSVVREVMSPRIDMVCMEADRNLAELRDLIIESKHSRIPIYRDRVDNIIGVVFLKDLPDAWRAGQESKSVVSLMRPAHFVPETMRVAQLLRDFQRERIQMAIVVDEYGGTSGLVTVEDLLEEIVGELADEHEQPTSLVAKQEDGSYLVSGKAEIEAVEELFDADLDREDYDTLAGMVVATLGRVPTVGERFAARGLDVEVVEADHRRVKKLRLRRSPAPVNSSEDAENPGAE